MSWVNLDDIYVPKNELLDLVYPIGSIYMSVNSTSPENLLGGGGLNQKIDFYWVRAVLTLLALLAVKPRTR